MQFSTSTKGLVKALPDSNTWTESSSNSEWMPQSIALTLTCLTDSINTNAGSNKKRKLYSVTGTVRNKNSKTRLWPLLKPRLKSRVPDSRQSTRL